MNKLALFTIGFVIAAVFGAINYALNADLRAVQTGEAQLVCFMKDGERVIDSSQVTGLVDGVWLFSNGHARNCEVKACTGCGGIDK